MLTIDNALAPEQVAALSAATDHIYERHLAEGCDARKAFFYPNFIPVDDLFAGLVDYAKVLPKVWGILGWNIYLYHAHLIVTPPSGAPPDDKTFGWHQDSGRVNVELESHPRPRLSLKVAYFLSDVFEPRIKGALETIDHLWIEPAVQFAVQHRIQPVLPLDQEMQAAFAVVDVEGEEILHPGGKTFRGLELEFERFALSG